MIPDGHPGAETLQARLDSELDAADMAAVDDHCRDCPGCRGKLDDLAAVRNWLGGDAEPGARQDVWPAVAARLERDRSHRLGPAFALSTAGVAALGIVLGLLAGTSDPAAATGVGSAGDASTGLSTGQPWSPRDDSSLLGIFTLPPTSDSEAQP